MIRIFQNKASKEATIDIDGTIGVDFWKMLDGEKQNTKEAMKKELKDIANLKADRINVNINSYGGDVNHGVSIHDLLAEHKAKVTTKVNGHTASAATIIAQAGDIRKMSDNALYLVHIPLSGMYGNKNDLNLVIQDLAKMEENLAKIYAKRGGMTIDEAKEFMARNEGRGEWLTAKEAKEAGFIDEIFEPTEMAAAIPPEQLQVFGLPGIPESHIPKTPEQNPQNKIVDKIKNKTNNSKVFKMERDNFEAIAKLGGDAFAAKMFREGKDLEAAKDVLIEDFKKENGELKAEKAENVAALNSANAQIEVLKAENQKLQDGTDPLDASNQSDPEKQDKEKPDFMALVNAKVSKDGCSIASAVAAVAKTNPEAHEAYINRANQEG